MPTLVETHLVPSRKAPHPFDALLAGFAAAPMVEIVAFTPDIYSAAVVAFDRDGKGRGDRAQLNFGD